MAAGTARFIGRLAQLVQSCTPEALTAMLLRTDSVVAPDLLAHLASAGSLDDKGLRELVTVSASSDAVDIAACDPAWLLQAGRLASLRPSEPDPVTGLAYFDRVHRTHGLSAFTHDPLALYAQLLARLDQRRLHQVLRAGKLRESYRWSVELDAMNPFTGAGESIAGWLATLNGLFAAHGLEPVSLRDTAHAPFDRLDARPSSSVDDDSMTTVVMSAYCPDQSIFTAVSSILAQSWRNLELLVIDDASPDEYQPILNDVADLDDRIRVIRAPSNSGTYRARNLALDHARGEYITFQDSDDWSHPRRIEHQVAALRADDRLLATRSWAVRAFPDLTFTYPGYPPDRLNASSLLFRRRPVVELIGYFDAVRKSADIEYPERLRAAAPDSLSDLRSPAPLAICQLRQGSLSRNDAKPGWMHWSRVAYRNSFRAWHTRVKHGGGTAYYDGDPERRPFPFPDSSWVGASALDSHVPYDAVILNDWRSARGPQHDVVDDIWVMLERGLRVAVSHAETLSPPPRTPAREVLSRSIQQLINAGSVHLVHITQPIHANLVMVYEPAALQFIPNISPMLKAERVAVLVDTVVDGDLRHVTVSDCIRGTERLFGRRPLWVPRNAPARIGLADRVDHAEVSEFDLYGSFDAAQVATSVRRTSGPRPVIGRHVPDHWTSWPASKRELRAAYPHGDRFDVRLFGGHRRALKVLGRTQLPPNWVSFRPTELDTRTFLAQLDFFVYFPHPAATEAPNRAIVEAMASGCVVIVPKDFEPLYDDAAVYCTPQDVRSVVEKLHGSPREYAEQQQRGHRLVKDRHSAHAFHARLERLLNA